MNQNTTWIQSFAKNLHQKWVPRQQCSRADMQMFPITGHRMVFVAGVRKSLT
jgi:hypothetical protein